MLPSYIYIYIYTYKYTWGWCWASIGILVIYQRILAFLAQWEIGALAKRPRLSAAGRESQAPQQPQCMSWMPFRQVMLAADKLLLTSTIRKNATELKGKELALHKAGTPSFGNRTSGTNICREWQVTDILLQSDCCVWMIGILNLLCRHPLVLVLPCPGTRNQNAGWLLSNGVTNYLRIDMVNCHRSILSHYSLYLPNQDFTECHWRVLVPLSTTKLRNNKLRVRLVPAWKNWSSVVLQSISPLKSADCLLLFCPQLKASPAGQFWCGRHPGSRTSRFCRCLGAVSCSDLDGCRDF